MLKYKMLYLSIKTVSACIVCASECHDVISSVIDEKTNNIIFETSLCQKCGSTFRTRQPDYCHQISHSTFRELFDYDWEVMRVYRYAKYVSTLESILKNQGVGCEFILDIGSNTGVGPSYLEDLGYSVFGVEQDADRAALSHHFMKNPERIYSGNFEDYIPKQKFDAIFLIHVLEHLHEPREMLAKIHTLLSDRGIFYVEVPDLMRAISYVDSFYFSHTVNFNKNSLEVLLNESGFTVVKDASSIFVNGDGTSIGFYCKKALKKITAHKSIQFSAVACKYQYKKIYCPMVFEISANRRVDELQKATFHFDDKKQRLVVTSLNSSRIARLQINKIYFKIGLLFVRGAIKLVSRFRYSAFLKSMLYNYNRALNSEPTRE